MASGLRMKGIAPLVRLRRRSSGARAAVALIVVAVAAPLVLSNFSLQLTALFLPLAMLAISVDLLWGENRLVSFGHGALFAAGGYVGGLILIGHTYNPIQSAASFLQSGNSESGLNRVLGWLHGVQIAGVPIAALVVAPIVVGLAALALGVVIFRVADPEIYIPLVTLGIGVVAELWFNDVQNIGAANGLSGIPSFSGTSAGSQYAFNLGFLAVVLIVYWRFRRSRWGALWRALGDDSTRLEALGYRVRLIRAVGFAVSAAVAALAGCLYGATSAVIGPTLADITFSAQPIIWIAVGGTGTLLGPVIGALAIEWLQQLLSSNLGLQGDWQLFLGLSLVTVVLVAPGGLMGSRRAALMARLPGRPRGVARGGAQEVGESEQCEMQPAELRGLAAADSSPERSGTA